MKIPVTTERREKVIEMRRLGYTFAQVSVETGLTANQAKWVMESLKKRSSIPPKNEKKTLLKTYDLDLIRKMRADGKSRVETALAVGCGVKTLDKIVATAPDMPPIPGFVRPKNTRKQTGKIIVTEKECEGASKKRKCSCCHNEFQPETRYLFRCKRCRTIHGGWE